MPPIDPHRNCDLHYACAPLSKARLVVVAAHGRYGATKDILKFANQVDAPDVAWIAPQAADGSWWGESFLAPLAMNEPGLTSAIARVAAIIANLERQGFRPEKTVLVGFSQGACLMLEYVARHPRPFRGIVAMSGGLIGSAEGDGKSSDTLFGHTPKQFDYNGNLAGVRINMGCHSQDPVIPVSRVQQSSCVLRRMGALVNLTTSPGKMHGVLQSDIYALRALLAVQ